MLGEEVVLARVHSDSGRGGSVLARVHCDSGLRYITLAYLLLFMGLAKHADEGLLGPHRSFLGKSES